MLRLIIQNNNHVNPDYPVNLVLLAVGTTIMSTTPSTAVPKSMPLS